MAKNLTFVDLIDGHLELKRAPVGSRMAELSEYLMLRDRRQQPPEVAAPTEGEAAGSRAGEKAAIDRHCDVFGVGASRQSRREPASSECRDPIEIARE